MEVNESSPEFLKDLNESQRKAVEYISGPSLVIAGAGSGKTRVLTYKIAYLLTQDIKPWEILALTFTNKAAKEMKERIIRLVGNGARYIRMGTFHSVFAQLLRAEAEKINYANNYTIYDESDSRSLCKAIIKELQLDEKIYKPAEVHNRISHAKNHLIGPAEYQQRPELQARDRETKMPQMGLLYNVYCQRCRMSNAMDFDDLLYNTYLLLRDHEEVRQKYASLFRFILVDEYQDTNYAQQQIIYLLAYSHKNICVVGDDAQSIYGFRGANIDNILNFQKQYEGSLLFKLEQNYRSTKRIVAAANSLIHKNERQIHKEVYSQNDTGEKIVLSQLSSDREEAMYVCRDIKQKMRAHDMKYSDFAVLYRTNSQSRTFEEQMLKEGMLYRVYGGLSFYQRKEIKDIVAYLRLVANPNDEEAFKRIINYPARGIGDTTVSKLLLLARERGVGVWDIVSDIRANAAACGINKGAVGKIEMFRQMIEDFISRLQTDNAYELGSEIIKRSEIARDVYSSTEPEYLSKQENMEEFLASMHDFVDDAKEEGNPVGLLDFLHEVALLTDRDKDSNTPEVTLMTIHSAKGLEFPCVYVVGLEENIFPSPLCTDSKRKLEEERRLLYVAITRAERFCILTYAKMRFRYGKMEFDAPSRFLRDIDRGLIEADSRTTFSSSRGGGFGGDTPSSRGGGYFGGDTPSSRGGYYGGDIPRQRPVVQKSPFASMKPVAQVTRTSMYSAPSPFGEGWGEAGGLAVGDTVQHDRFGTGRIVKFEGTADSLKATVEFQNAGVKQLLLKYARLKKIT